MQFPHTYIQAVRATETWFRKDMLSPGLWQTMGKNQSEDFFRIMTFFCASVWSWREEEQKKRRKDVKANIQYLLWIIMKQIKQIAPVDVLPAWDCQVSQWSKTFRFHIRIPQFEMFIVSVYKRAVISELGFWDIFTLSILMTSYSLSLVFNSTKYPSDMWHCCPFDPGMVGASTFPKCSPFTRFPSNNSASIFFLCEEIQFLCVSVHATSRTIALGINPLNQFICINLEYPWTEDRFAY